METKYEKLSNDEFTSLVSRAIMNQGRRTSWIAEQMKVYPQTLRNKLNGATQWSESERLALESMLDL